LSSFWSSFRPRRRAFPDISSISDGVGKRAAFFEDLEAPFGGVGVEEVAKGTLKSGFFPVSIDKMKKVSDRIDDITDAFLALAERVSAEMTGKASK
jgi:hypothetical protein